MSKKVYTPPIEDCPECEELINSKCVVEEESLPSLGIRAGGRLNTILKTISKKFGSIIKDLKRTIFNVQPLYSNGLPIFTYTDDACSSTGNPINIPLFLNGKVCFEYDDDVTVNYTNENMYCMFFNYSHCNNIFIDPLDTVQITQISGIPLSTPIIIKNSGDIAYTIDDANKIALLTDINTLTGSTFTDIVTDTTLSINGDLVICLYDPLNASATFTTTLTFEYEVLDSLLVLKDTRTETISTRNTTGTGISTVNIVDFSVVAIGGVYNFYDDLGVLITNQVIIDFLTNLILTQEVRVICCADCTGGTTPLPNITMDTQDVLNLRAPGATYVGGTVINSEIHPRIVDIYGDFNNSLIEIADDAIFTTNVIIVGRTNSTAAVHFTFNVPEGKFYRIINNGSSFLFWNETQLKIV